MTGPYADAAWAYREAGWKGVIPIGNRPEQKSPPPAGYTGYAGVDPSGADVQAWVDGPEGARNIGLHLPPGVYVLDVDAHSGKPATESLLSLVAKCGALPKTWSNTARGADAASRQFFFRAELPEGRVWKDHPGSGLDSLHVGHRYAVVAPSIHPTGTPYEWYDETGELYEGPPETGWLAKLPARWVDELSKPGEPMAGTAASDDETFATVQAFRAGEMCRQVEAALKRELERVGFATDGGSLHDPGALFPLVAYGIEGHRGVAYALALHQAAYVEARVRLRGEASGSASADWWRQVRGAVGKKLLASKGEIAGMCECDDPFAGIIAPSSTQPILEESVSQPTVPLESPFAETPPAAPAAEATMLDILRGQLLNTKTLGSRPKAVPLVPGAFFRDKLGWMYGAPKSFKSFLALDLAGCVANGLPWQGFPAGQPGKVLYLVAEGASGIEDRVRAWEEHNGLDMADVEFLPVAIQANSPEQWKAFVALAIEIGPALVVVDTQARVTSGMEENSATEMGEFVRRLDQLRVATGALVLTVHHSGRNGEHMRGSIAIDGAADTVLRIVRDEDRCTVTCVYQKDAEEFEPFLTRVTKVADSLALRRDTDAIMTAGGRPLPSFLKDWWKNHETDLVAPSLLYRTGVVTESTFHEHAKDLVRRGVLVKDETTRYPTYRLVSPPPGSEAHSETPAVRHAGVSESGASGSGRSLPEPPGVSPTGPLCSICGEALDHFLVRRGATTHPTC